MYFHSWSGKQDSCLPADRQVPDLVTGLTFVGFIILFGQQKLIFEKKETRKMKRNLAIVLAIAMVFYMLPVRAAEEPVYHFFNIGSHPVDPNRQIDPVTECRVELTEPSPTVRLSFVKNGEVGETRPGNIRSGYVIVVDKVTGFAKWVSLCGNDVVEPKNWIPVGRKVCGDQPVQPATSSVCDPSCGPEPTPTPAPVEAAAVSTPVPAAVTPTPTATPASTSVSAQGKGKEKGNGWKVAGNILLGAAAGVLVCALTGKCDFRSGGSSSGGSPSPKPPNGPSSGPSN